MRCMLWICGLAVAALGLAAGALGADKEPEVTRMTVYPAAEPRPALKYKLLPEFMEKRSGNAAVVYNGIWAEESRLVTALAPAAAA